MVAPDTFVILSPIVFLTLHGYRLVSGMPSGTFVSGIQITFSAFNTGGVWYIAKKYVEAGRQESAQLHEGRSIKNHKEG
jgi:Na+/H+-translocating membrane pyrophosphatase